MVFPEGNSTKILKALRHLQEEKICQPILLGNPDRIREKMTDLELHELENITILNPTTDPLFHPFAQELYKRRQRKGVNFSEAQRLISDSNYFGAMMVLMGYADAMMTGATQDYANAVRPILQTIGISTDGVPAGLNIVLLDDEILILADTTVNINPSAEQLAKIGIQAARVMNYFGITPRIAMLSYTNFTGQGETPSKMKKAAQILRSLKPELILDGDMQADTAANTSIQERIFPFCNLKGRANILLFPNLESSNICYKLLQQIGKLEVLGPFLMGVRQSANVLQRTTTVEGIFNSCVLTALEAQYILEYRKNKTKSISSR